MARVFLSYDHDDEERAAPIVAALEKAGHTVWWDRQIHGGAQYVSEIENAVADADAVVVLWSERSVQSAWVRDEAAEGRDSGKLVPVALDATKPPMGFRQFQTIDLSGARGRGRSARIAQILTAIDTLGGCPPPQPATHSPSRQPRQSGWRRGYTLAIAGLALVAIATGLLYWRLAPSRSTLPVVAVRPADSAPEARSLARDLLVRLGAPQAGHADPVQLVDEGGPTKPDLILEVSGSSRGQRPSANLVLLRGADRQLLSSQDFSAPEGKLDDLDDSLAMSAAVVLGCASDALAARPHLRLDVLKLYLGACQRLPMLYGSDEVSILVPQLGQVVEDAPEFLPARKRLLLVGAFMHATPSDHAKPSTDWLRRHVDAARAIDGTMPELGLAQLELIAPTDHSARIRQIDGLKERYPDDPFVLVRRAEELSQIGRMNDAVVDSERAKMLEPEAPFTRDSYIRALAYSGRIPRAFEELKEAAPLALNAMNLTETRFRLNMRFGDPAAALKILRMYGTSKQHEAFLLARIEPTRENIDRAVAISASVAADRGFYASHAEVLAEFGRNDEIFRMLTSLPIDRADPFLFSTLFHPTLKAFRQEPRFLRVAQRLGLVDYWRSSGHWPDFCSEPGLPYDCKAEAAKLIGKGG